MLIELAIGDAYGAGFEYVDPATVRAHNTLRGYVQHPRHRIRPGAYTDDTQMSLAIAETLTCGTDWTPPVLAEAFVTAFHRDPRDGYAQRFHDFLTRTRTGPAFLAGIAPNSDKSGAAMRAAPIGVLPSIDEVIHHATIQARLTHDTPGGIAAARAAALMAHYFLYSHGPRQDLPAFLHDHVDGDWDWTTPWQGKVGAQGIASARAAATALTVAPTMTSLLKTCVDYTGDVDTVAAIALAAGAAATDIDQDLPAHLYDGLENGPYGRDYITALDRRLLTLRAHR
jgi:ADP-ribosyl-[dinitrogen reductase] hydrolase